MNNTQQTLLSIVVSPSVEDSLVDWLLEVDDVTGFTSFPVNGHGSSVHSMNLSEQVAGSRRKILFQTYLSQSQALQILDKMKQDFDNCGIHYWLTPLSAGGHL